MTRNALIWFEIPAVDLDRAQRLYQTVLATVLERRAMGPEQMAIFAATPDDVGGCLHGGAEPVAPSREGTRVYLDAAPSIDAALARVAAAGGRVATPKVTLPEGMGYDALIEDSEGSVVGLHASA